MHSSKDIKFGERIKRLRKLRSLSEGFNISQIEIANKIDISYGTYQRYEHGYHPNRNNLKKIIWFYDCNEGWLLTGEGEPFDNQETIDKKRVTYNKEGAADICVAEQRKHGTGVDEFGQAVAGLKEIFDSHDPVLIPAIQANIHAFQISVRRKHHVQQQSDEITALKKENTNINTRLEAIEKRLAQTTKTENTEKKVM